MAKLGKLLDAGADEVACYFMDIDGGLDRMVGQLRRLARDR